MAAMKINSQFSSSLLFLLGLASLGVVVFFNNAARIINALVIASIIVLTVSPVMFGLKRRGFPTWAAYTVTVLVLLAVLLIFVLIVVGAGQQFIQALPEYSAQSESSMASIESKLNAWGVENLGLYSGAMAEIYNTSNILDRTGRFITGLVDTFSNGILIGTLILFMLVDAIAVPSKLAAYLNTESPFILRLSRYTILVRR